LAGALRGDSSIAVKRNVLQELVNKRGEAELSQIKDAARAAGTLNSALCLSVLSGRRELDLELLTLNYYRRLTTEQLLEVVTWSGVSGEPAYRVLATERYESISDSIREDIETNFERIRTE
jgi:hypothetical protein